MGKNPIVTGFFGICLIYVGLHLVKDAYLLSLDSTISDKKLLCNLVKSIYSNANLLHELAKVDVPRDEMMAQCAQLMNKFGFTHRESVLLVKYSYFINQDLPGVMTLDYYHQIQSANDSYADTVSRGNTSLGFDDATQGDLQLPIPPTGDLTRPNR
jgi:hypothetical protein